MIIILAVGGIGIATNGTFKFSSASSSDSSNSPSSTSPTTSPSDSSSDNTTTPTPAPTPAAITVTADELFSAYTTNAETAKTTYKGKVVSVSGKVAAFDLNAPSVTIKGDSTEDFDIDCFFSSGDKSTINNLEPDQAVKVKGTVGDFVAGLLQITGCTFAN